MDDRGGGEQEWGGRWRKPKITVFTCFCPAHLTHPTHTVCCRKQLCTYHPFGKVPVCPPSPSQCLQAAAQAAEGLLLGNIALIIRSRASFLAGEGNYLHLSWAGKASFLLLLHISSPLPPMSFVLCQNPCMGKSWLMAGTGAPQHPRKWVRRGRTLLGWWLDFTPRAPSLTTPHSVKPLGHKWGQICHHRSGRATLLMTRGLRNKRKAPWGNLLTVTLDINLLCFRKSTCMCHTWEHYRGATCTSKYLHITEVNWGMQQKRGKCKLDLSPFLFSGIHWIFVLHHLVVTQIQTWALECCMLAHSRKPIPAQVSLIPHPYWWSRGWRMENFSVYKKITV